ncbi:hypothetical protein CQW23_03149 [Capsicum baccatum]|uniref:Uncharacterized protein n=1 Tax=Capsicum baccatum TaxID=33114 RepID=A0A2G2XB10_CAPBA|nr:hypothetical protein CQW23_03149 [Capsicum baccatum]
MEAEFIAMSSAGEKADWLRSMLIDISLWETTIGRSGKRPVVDIQSQSDHDIQGFEDFSTLPPTKILKKAHFLSDASTSQHTKRRRTVRFDSATVEEQVYQKTPFFVSIRTVPTQKIPSSDSQRVHAENTTPSSSSKSVRQENSDEKWDEIKLFFQSYDVEGVSADIGPATLESLIIVVENLKPDSANVGTSTMQVDYSSTLSESAQVELDAILEGIATPVDDLPIEVVPPSEVIVNKHDISDSQLPPDFSDAVVATHQTAKTPAKRIRTRSKVFMSPYMTEYAFGSKAIEDQIGESKQKFAFDGFLISDNMPRGVIEEYKQWVDEGLMKFHAKKYAEYLSEEINVPSDGFEAEYHRMRYATLLRKYGIQKA